MPSNRAEKASSPNLMPGMHVHLVGIGGTGLSAVAQVLLGRGFKVSGSDLQLNEMTTRLEEAGAILYEGHNAQQISGADMLLVSSAIPPRNPEITAATSIGIPILKRSEFIGELMRESYGIAVAGTHGKTTTTGMIAQIMIDAGLDPTVIVGAELPALGSNGRAGHSDYFVIEADEYDYMFHGLQPSLAVVTNVEYDHPDLFADQEEYGASFRKFVEQITSDGYLFACADDVGAEALAKHAQALPIRVTTYGVNKGEWRASDLRSNQLGGSDFLVQRDGSTVGLARLRVPGEHNVRNALGAIAAASTLGVGFNTIRTALGEFGGLGRRFQLLGEAGDVAIVDDYAHHPTEIEATLAAARQRFSGRRIWAVWQPHTYSRTKAMLRDFAGCFEQADRVIALDIYRSREQDTMGMNTAQVVDEIVNTRVDHVGSIDEAADYLLERVLPGDVVITLSAGDGNKVGEILMRKLRQRDAIGSGLMGK
ncbi:MAG: UDP-N-acetylmuramate--L-alanine ligase [Chloroflexota bacterium]